MKSLLGYLSQSLKLCVFAFFVLVSTKSFAQSFSCPNANRCTSKDLSIVGAFLTGGSCACSATGTQTATLNMTINNTTGSTRTSFAFFGTLVQTDPNGTRHLSSLSGCGGPLPPNTITTIVVNSSITYNCDQTLSLENVFLAWTDASGESVSRCADILADACVHIAPKCGTAPVIPINPLLSLQTTNTDGCTGRSEGQIKITPIGGKPKYSVQLKQGGVTVAGPQNNVTSTGYTFTGLAEGIYDAVVTDSTGCVYTKKDTLGSHFCCTAPTIQTNASNVSVCAGDPTSFTASATGGNPTPTIQWQEKVGAGSFTNITNGGVYSGATTGTLSISNTTGKNGNQYRAVFTSAGCDPVNSAATLTLYALPPSPNTVYHAPPTCNDSTYSVEVTNVFANATYTITDKNGDNIPGVQPGNSIHTSNTNNITFSHIPAGSGYIISVVTDNNCSPSNSPTVCGTPTTINRATSRTTEMTTPSQAPTVKAYPNPFSDKINFVVTTSISGKGTLEVYNMMGQKIRTVYQGFISAGTQTFQMSSQKQQVANLIYVLRIGDKKVSGKILQINQ